MRWGLLLILVCLIVSVSAPGPALAADEVKEKAKEKGKADGKEHHAPADSGKIDLFKGALDLTIWTIVVFLILFFVLNTFAWPQIRAGLDKRESDIARDKAEADKAKKEAEAARAELAAKMAKANDEIRMMIDKARADAQATAAAEIARGKEELTAERTRLRDEMARARDQALQEVWQSGATLATLISEKAIRKNLTVDDHRALVDDALKEFRTSAEARLQDLTSARA
jgi:F-type H+-transporting ATPase subunit b